MILEPQVVLYRCPCRYCDIAEEELVRLREGIFFSLSVKNVAESPELKPLAGWSTPIVCVDGRPVSRYRLDVVKWEESIGESARRFAEARRLILGEEHPNSYGYEERAA